MNKPKITYNVECLPEDIPVKGAFAYDTEAENKEAEDRIRKSLQRGNQWAWCFVRVVASAEIDGQVYKGSDALGCCSYTDEQDFRRDGYYRDMRGRALDALKDDMRAMVERGEAAREALLKLE